MVRIDAAKADTSWNLVPSVGQTPKTIGPTFPIRQLKNVFH